MEVYAPLYSAGFDCWVVLLFGCLVVLLQQFKPVGWEGDESLRSTLFRWV
jgi:hypothetical protein